MKPISSNDLREKYQQFFESKGHARIPPAPLVPENDPSVLFTTAGMHPLVPFLKGEPHPQGPRLTNVQKCLRTTDIDSVGDKTHATVFEMLGNWSLGDYGKTEAIAFSWEFLTHPAWLAIDPKYLAVSVFAGDNDAPTDSEAAQNWLAQGVAKSRIAYLDKKENWWPAGGGAPGPQGPDTEMFYWTGIKSPPIYFDPSDNNWVELWNDVFMQYNLTTAGVYETLPKPNIDTGMGLERVVMVLSDLPSIYEIDSYEQLMKLLQTHVKQPNQRHLRIVADHIKAATFILGDEHPQVPSKTEQGYVLRRIIRRATRSCRELGIKDVTDLMQRGMELIVNEYNDTYPSLSTHLKRANEVLAEEIAKFQQALNVGLKQFDKSINNIEGDIMPGKIAFELASTYGFPIELTQEMASEHKKTVDMGAFEEAAQLHQKKSRSAIAGKFAGGLKDHSIQSIKYHTATHLLHQALRNVLGKEAQQRGSNITQERLRFDFSYPHKLSDTQISQVEAIVNDKISSGIPVKRSEMLVQEAKTKGALGLFEHKYSDLVSVYSIGDYSLEICGGPHVSNTRELGVFQIVKEESAGAGLRRIRAILK